MQREVQIKESMLDLLSAFACVKTISNYSVSIIKSLVASAKTTVKNDQTFAVCGSRIIGVPHTFLILFHNHFSRITAFDNVVCHFRCCSRNLHYSRHYANAAPPRPNITPYSCQDNRVVYKSMIIFSIEKRYLLIGQSGRWNGAHFQYRPRLYNAGLSQHSDVTWQFSLLHFTRISVIKQRSISD